MSRSPHADLPTMMSKPGCTRRARPAPQDQQVSTPSSSEQDDEELVKTPYLNRPLSNHRSWLQSSIEDHTHFLEDLRNVCATLRETDAFLGNLVQKYSSRFKELHEIPDVPPFLSTPDTLPSPPSPIKEATISSFFRRVHDVHSKRALQHAATKPMTSDEDDDDTTVNMSKPSPPRPKVILAGSKAASTAGPAPASLPTTPAAGRAPCMVARGMELVLPRQSRRGQKDGRDRESFSTERVLRRRHREDDQPTTSTSNSKRRKM